MCIENDPGNPVMPNTEIRKCLRKKILESRWCNRPESDYRLTKHITARLDEPCVIEIELIRENMSYDRSI